ncbi:hypothetical protein [Methylomonas sp. MK1]|uniref:hypothetical protein n=1 Tax=Methylomonas sp. MK1 TaxID=1131552 RepID=UPI001F365065|nr:hypothetical protein [Methylomonas sp. MK1]
MEITIGAVSLGSASTVGSTLAALGFGLAFFAAALTVGAGAFSVLSGAVGASVAVFTALGVVVALGLALVLPGAVDVSCAVLTATGLVGDFLVAFAGAGFSVAETGVSDVGVVFFILAFRRSRVELFPAFGLSVFRY